MSFRLPDETIAQIDQIARRQGGLAKTRVIQLAIDRLWNQVFPSQDAGKKSRKIPISGIDL